MKNLALIQNLAKECDKIFEELKEEGSSIENAKPLIEALLTDIRRLKQQMTDLGELEEVTRLQAALTAKRNIWQ